jgi:hypothetical protein
MEELLNPVKNPGELLCIGDGCGKYIDILEESAAKKNISYIYLKNFIPDGKAAVELTLRKYKESPEKFINFDSTVPFYTRKSDAEIAKDNR